MFIRERGGSRQISERYCDKRGQLRFRVVTQHYASRQVIESYREDGKVKQRVGANLGPCATVADAIAHWVALVAKVKKEIADHEGQLGKIAAAEKVNFTTLDLPYFNHSYQAEQAVVRLRKNLPRLKEKLAKEQAQLKLLRSLARCRTVVSEDSRQLERHS
jgi:hypothetical protein